jgi:hypothetical protein
MAMIKVRAADGRRVRHPATRQLIPAEGLMVNDHEQHWFRRLRDGDVIEIDDDGNPVSKPAAEPPATAASAKTRPSSKTEG